MCPQVGAGGTAAWRDPLLGRVVFPCGCCLFGEVGEDGAPGEYPAAVLRDLRDQGADECLGGLLGSPPPTGIAAAAALGNAGPARRCSHAGRAARVTGQRVGDQHLGEGVRAGPACRVPKFGLFL
jgi:hypothetical protein